MASRLSKDILAPSARNIPHSWDISTWPESVWPSDPKRALWVARAYRRELLDVGALARSGKTLIFFGHGYLRWLERRKANVEGWGSNNPAVRPRKSL